MADEPNDVVLDEEIEGEEPEIDQEQAEAEAPEGDEEEVIAFEGEEEAAPASGERDTDLVRHLRAELRKKEKLLAERSRQEAPKPIEVGPRPALADYDYDEDAHTAAVDAWLETKRAADAQKAEAEAERQRVAETWDQEKQRYAVAKAAIAKPDYDDAESEVIGKLSQVQQMVLVRVADDAAKLTYALGRSPTKLETLSKIDDPLKLAAAVAKLEGTLKVVTRRKAPDPEQIARGSASLSASSDKALERLEKEADRTGDSTALVAYKRSLKSKA